MCGDAMRETIHTVTGVRSERRETGSGKPYDTIDVRCFGWYPERAEAIEACLGNSCDINECGYWPWLVVESVRPGVYGGSMSDSQYWFLWVKEGHYAGEGHYEPCDPPEGVAESGGIVYCAFGIG